MLANPKYLNKNPWQRFAKISCGLLGGYLITALLHLIFSIVLPWHQEVLVTSVVTFFPIWCILLILPFVLKNGWRTWLLYLAAIVLLYAAYYFLQPMNPFVNG